MKMLKKMVYKSQKIDITTWVDLNIFFILKLSTEYVRCYYRILSSLIVKLLGKWKSKLG